jgi:hypothetical protein
VQHLVHLVRICRGLPHPLEKGTFVAAVAEDLEVVVAGRLVEEPLEDVSFLLLVVGPEGESLGSNPNK